MPNAQTAEHARLAEATGRAEDDLFSANPWYEWGPYLSERAWGTVREDYSESGDAWDSFPHDHARSRAYRWNEDGMAGICDIRHDLCLALALWNGNDPILKERMFGLTGPQGNHGEDVKEYWWYLDGLPSHALLQLALPLPAGRVPVRAARRTTAAGPARPRARAARHRASSTTTATGRSTSTYAKASPTEVLMRIERREPRARTRRRSTCCRRCGSATPGRGATRRRVRSSTGDGSAVVVADHALAGYRLEAAPGPDGAQPEALFCENETNAPRVFGSEATTPYPKDGINDHVVSGADTVNPDGVGTKAAFRYRVTVAAGRQGRAAAASPSARDGAEALRPSRRGRATRSTRSSPRARPTRTSSTRRSRRKARPPTRCRSCGRPAPASSGASRCTRTTCAAGSTATPASRRRPGHASTGGTTRLAAPRLVRRALDAGSVGVPVVRRLGPGIPLRAVGAPRSGVREVPGARAAARVVPAPQRRPAGLRVELRRRQPAGARDGGAARLQDRRRHRSRVPRAGLPEAARQLHLVGQPRGRRRQQRVQRRLPRARQHQPDRPLEPARRRRARAGRRHGVDGVLRDVDARDRDRARRGERRLPGHGDQVPRAVRADRAGARPAGPLRRRRRVLLRPARLPVGRVDAGEGADDLGPDPGASRRGPAGQGGRARRQARQALRAPARRLGGDRRKHDRSCAGDPGRAHACSCR